MPGRGFGRGPITARGGRGQPISLSEVKVRVGPVPTDWSLARVKDALFQIGQVDVAYVGKTAADDTVTDGMKREALFNKFLERLDGDSTRPLT